MEPEIRPPEAIPPEINPPKQNTGLWGGWLTAVLGIAIFAIYFIVQTVVAVVFIFNRLITGLDLTDFQSIIKLANNGDLISIATIVSAIFGVGFIILFIKIRKGAGLRDYLGLKSIPKKTYLILLGIVIGLVILSTVLGQVLHVPDNTGFTVDAYKTTTWPAVLWLAVAVFAPLFEETFFRSFLLVGFNRTRMGAVGAIAITAVTWALLHIQYDVFGMASILVLGIVLGIVRIKTKSLWSTIFIHALWNLVAIAMATLYVNGIVR